MSSDRIRSVEASDGATMQASALVLGLFALLVAVGCGGGSTSAMNNSSNNGGGGSGAVAATISDTITVGTAPSAIAVDPTNNKVYVSDFGTRPQVSGSQFCSPTGADITVIDGATGTHNASTLGPNPIAMALNPANHTVYVVVQEWGPVLFTGKGCAHYLDGTVAIDTSTLLSTGPIAQWLDSGDAGIDVNQTNGSIYITHAQNVSGEIVGIVDDMGVATISVGTKPAGVAVNTTTNKIYVANSGSNDVSVIDGTSNSVLATITDPNAVAPIAVALNPMTNTIYVANSQSNNLTIIDGTTDLVTATISVGTSPSGVAVDSKTNFIYVANAGNAQAGDPGSITVLNGATDATTTLTDPKAVGPSASAVNSATNKIYVANSGSNNVTVIDGAHD